MPEAEKTAPGDWSFFAGDEGYEALKRRRAIAAALAARQRGFPKTLGEGLTYFGESLGEAIADWRLRQQEAKSTAANAGLRTPAPEDTRPPAYTEPTDPPTTPPTTAAPGQAATDFSPAVDPGEGTPVSVVEVPPPAPPPPAASVFPDPPPPPVAAVEPPPNVMPGARPVQTTSFRPPPAPVDLATPEPPPEQAASVSTAAYAPPAGPTASFAARAEPFLPAPAPPSPLNDRAAALVAPAQPQPELPPDVPQAAPEPAPGPQTAAPPQAIPFEGPMPDPRWAARLRALAGIESGGSRTPYQLEGAVTKSGDQAQGKYQVMGANVPAWTKAALGYPLTPDEFRAHPNAQDITARHRLGGYVNKYGDEKAARAWYAGEEGMKNLGATDVHGRLTVAGYGRDFMNRMAADPGGPDPGTGEERPVMASRGGTGRGTPGGVPEAPLDQRDVIAAALMERPQPPPGGVQQAQASPEDIQSEALLRESMGMRRPGSPFKATASRGDIGTDAPLPGLSPIGSATGAAIGDSVQQRQRIYDAVQQQQQAPAVPPVDPTLAATTSPPSTQSGTGSDPVRLAQALPPGIRPDTGSIWPAVPGAPAPPPATPTDIRPAPGMPPSREAIPPASVETMPDPGPEPKRPPQLGPSPAQQYWMKHLNNPNVSDAVKAHALRKYNEEETYRKELQTRADADYTDKREAWQAARLAKQKHEREAPTREIDQLNKRLQVENQQAAAAKTPYELQQAQLAVDKTRLEIATARRALEKPDAFESGGARYERPYDAGGRPSGPYTLAPGSPPPKEEITADQASATQFVARVKPDLKTLDTELGHGAVLTVPSERARDLPGVGNYTVSDEYRRAKAIMTNFEGAFMQRVSGAAVSESEGRRNMPAFQPAVGDTPQDLADKAERRNRFVEAVEASAGPAGKAAIHRVLAESSEYLYQKAGERPPVKVTTPAEADALEPGTRIIRPDGQPGRVPRKRL